MPGSAPNHDSRRLVLLGSHVTSEIWGVSRFQDSVGLVA